MLQKCDTKRNKHGRELSIFISTVVENSDVTSTGELTRNPITGNDSTYLSSGVTYLSGYVLDPSCMVCEDNSKAANSERVYWSQCADKN